MVHGFENSHNMYKIRRPMEVVTVPGGIILPRKEVENGPMWGLGGVCDAEGEFVSLSYYDGGWATQGGAYSYAEPEHINEDVVYFGLYFTHWGHFLIDLMGRLWYYAKGLAEEKHLKLAYIGEEEPKGNFLEIFRLLGIDPADMIHVTKPTKFRNVIVPEFSCKSCQWYSQEYQAIFDAMIDRVEMDGYTPEWWQGEKKIYFSRRSFGKAKHSEFGEENIVTWLAANGFTAVAPEQLSVRDQIYLWNHAEEIACLDGSIPMSLAFSRHPKLKLTILHKTSLEHLNVELYLLMRPCRVALLDVWYEPFKGYPKNIGAGPFLLHLGEDARQYSTQRGWGFPFSDKQLEKDKRRNRRKLAWRIIDLDSKLRLLASKLLPQCVKDGLRRLRHG